MAVDLPEVIGLPPSTHISDQAMLNSMPVAHITPCNPHFEPGMTIFRTEDAWGEYTDILKEHGFVFKSKPLSVAFLADNFPTDSFTNEYGESFLQRFTDVASSGAAQIAQFFGAKSAGEVLGKATKALKDTGGVAGMIGGGLETARESITKAFLGLAGAGGPNFQNAAVSAANLLGRLMAGARVDFPQVWKNSGFSPSYTMTVRLYNPNPSNDASTLRYIIGPIASLMLLAVPRSEDGSTYNYPFLHRIFSPGIYDLNPAFISNVTIIKGGDQQQISFSQSLSMVDVRIDFGSLYNSMLTGKGYQDPSRPTMRSYLDGMMYKRRVSKLTFKKGEKPSNVPDKVDIKEASPQPFTVKKPQESPSYETDAGSRVSNARKAVEARLRIGNIEIGFGS